MMRPDWQQHVHPDDLPRFIEARAKMQAGEENVANTYRYRRRDGSWCWIEARLHLVRSEDGRPKEFVANMRDITRQKDAELKLETALAELAEQATTDGLTGVANRRRFDAALDQEWRRSLRAGEFLAVLLIDADHFKAFNDRYGHQAGDDCLRAIASTTAAQIRRSHDICARYGGEEFVVILPATGLEGASDVAERIRDAIEGLDLPHEANADGVVTVSIGVAAVRVDLTTTSAMLVEAADAALYRAKRAGRNRIESGLPSGPATVVALLPHLRRAAASMPIVAAQQP
jgi:diguanylate cyclase (GGDEF)-like protein